MSYKVLSETNPVLFIQDFVETIKTTNYRFDYEKSTVVTYPVCEAVLHDTPDYKTFVFDVENVQANAIIDSRGWHVFLSTLQDYVLSGWEPDITAFNWDVILGGIQIVVRNPSHPSLVKYTKEEMDNLEWEELKRIGRCHNLSGRDRRLLTNNILKAMEE